MGASGLSARNLDADARSSGRAGLFFDFMAELIGRRRLADVILLEIVVRNRLGVRHCGIQAGLNRESETMSSRCQGDEGDESREGKGVKRLVTTEASTSL